MISKRTLRTPQEKLKEKLYKIDISENYRKTKGSFDTKEFIKKAKEARETFKEHGNALSSDTSY